METVGHLAAPLTGIGCSAAAGLWFRRRGLGVMAALAGIIAAGLAAARLAFVFQHADSYRDNLLLVLDMTDGGFSAMAGLFAALVAGAELTRKTAALRRPLVIAGVAGIAAWVAASIAMLDFAPAQTLVPLVELRRLDGSPVQLRTLTNKPMVLNLWATWCPPCRRETPVLREAQRRNPDIAFVFVNQGESAAAIERYLALQGLDLDNLLVDTGNAVAQRTASFAYPTTLFFDGDGKLFMRQVGELDKHGLDQRLGLLRKTGR